MRKNILPKAMLVFLVTLGVILAANPSMAELKGKYGGTLTTSETETFTQFGVPWKIRGAADQAIRGPVQPLLFPSKPGEYEPILATSWEVTPDKSAYIIHLRKGVKFHDGTDFNAQAVKWNWDMLKASKRPTFRNLTTTEVIDDYTVKANLSKWTSTTLLDISSVPCMIISPTYYETNDPKVVAVNPVGTGPFKMGAYKPRSFVRYDKFKDYWSEGYPYLDSRKTLIVPDKMTQEIMFLNGDLDIMKEVDGPTSKELYAKGFKPAPLLVGGQFMLYFNTEDPKSVWSNQKLREALEYAIDKKLICDSIGKGFLSPQYEIIFGLHTRTDPDTTPREYNPEKARQLLKEAGYPNGLKVEMVTEDKFYSDQFLAIQQMVKDIGIDLTVSQRDSASWNGLRFGVAPVNMIMHDRQRGGEFELLKSLNEDLSTRGIFYKGLKRPDNWDNMIDEALGLTGEAQLEVLVKMERMAYDDMAMFVPLWAAGDMNFLNAKVMWDKSVREDPWHCGGQPYIRNEFIWLDE